MHKTRGKLHRATGKPHSPEGPSRKTKGFGAALGSGIVSGLARYCMGVGPGAVPKVGVFNRKVGVSDRKGVYVHFARFTNTWLESSKIVLGPPGPCSNLLDPSKDC